MKILVAATLVPVFAAQALAVGVTLTYGTPAGIDKLELKPGESCELKAAGHFYKQDQNGILTSFPGGFTYVDVVKDGAEWRLHLWTNTGTGVDVNQNRFSIAGPAMLTVSGRGPGYGTTAGGFATFEVTPAPAALEKLVVVPEGQGARLVLEASTNLNSWAPIFSTVLTNVPANQFIRVRSEKAP